MFDIYNVIS